MKTFKSYITEAYKNIFFADQAQREQYAEEVYSILQKAYESIGGLKGGGLSSKEDMIESIPFWKVALKDGRVVAVMLYKDTKGGGRKRIALATDGTPLGKKTLADMIQSEYRTGRSMSEVSGPSLRFIMKQFSASEIKEFLIPVERVRELLPTDTIRAKGKYHYERQLRSGAWVSKIMLGNPDAKKIAQPELNDDED